MKVFDLVIYAIVFLVLIILFYELINAFFPPSTEIGKIKNALTIAQTEGYNRKSISAGIIQYQNGLTIDAAQFASKDLLIAFECNNAGVCCIKAGDAPQQKCDKEFSWDPTYLKVNETKQALTTIRCTRTNNYPLCKIFVGSLPGQTKIEKIEVLEQNKAIGELKITTTNSGSTIIAPGKLSLKLYKKLGTSWTPTDYTSEPKDVETIVPGENYSLLWSINPKNSGEYKAEFTYESMNGGLDTSYAILTIDSTIACTINNSIPSETIYYPDTSEYREIHSCSECNYAYECASAWSTQTGKTFIGISQNQAYCAKTSENGAC